MARAKMTVELTISLLPDKAECIDDGFESFEDMVRWLIAEEGHFIGVIDDGFKILSVEELKDE